MPQDHISSVNLAVAQEFLQKLLEKELEPDAYQWVKDTREELQKGWDSMSFHLSFGMVARKIPRKLIRDKEKFEAEAHKILPGWFPHLWTLDRIARVLFISTPAFADPQKSHDFVWDTFDTADMWEQVAIFSSLAILPFPEMYVKLAAEGLRTNMAPVFDAVAMENPFPMTWFSDEAWNQMYLKAAFSNRPIYRISGIPVRANKNLSGIILDYAHERWAAGREVTPEIWQASAPFLSEKHIEDLLKLASHKDETQRAVLALLREQVEVSAFQNLDLQLTQSWTWESLGIACNPSE